MTPFEEIYKEHFGGVYRYVLSLCRTDMCDGVNPWGVEGAAPYTHHIAAECFRQKSTSQKRLVLLILHGF